MNKIALMALLFAVNSATAGELTESKPARPAEVPKEAVEIKPGLELNLPPVDKLITYTSNYYQNKQFKDKYMGKLAAIEGKVKKIESAEHGQKIYLLDLGQSVEKPLWVASMVLIDDEFVKVGTNVRVLGYFDEVAKETQFMTKLSKDKEYMLGMCFYDTKIDRPMYRPRWMSECQKWEDGTRLPKLNP